MNCEMRVNPPRKCKRQNTVPEKVKHETPDALLNDVVLQNIFKFLGFQDLKSCREVGNSTWLRNAKKAWWSRTKVIFKGGDCLEERIVNFLEETEISSSATNYSLEEFKAGYDRFVGELGSSIKYLELKRCKFPSVDNFRQLVYTQCPNLESLILVSVAVENIDAEGIVEPLEWQNPQFGQHNNLKILRVDAWILTPLPVSYGISVPLPKFAEIYAEGRDIFRVISIIRQHNARMLKLKQIKMRTPCIGNQENSIRSVFLDQNLPLEVIEFPSCEPETVMDILDFHAESLTEVSIYGHLPPPPIRHPHQPLQILEELSVAAFCLPVSFFKFTPNVRTVSLRLCNMIQHHTSGEPNIQINTCNELKLFANEYAHNLEGTDNSIFEYLIRTFPNVETLLVDCLDNHSFSMVCDHLTKLVTFYVRFGLALDVTGLLGYDPDSKAKDRVRNPNITNLKNLQSFVADLNLDDKREMTATKKVGRILLNELRKIPHLRTFELMDRKLAGKNQIWKEILKKYLEKSPKPSLYHQFF